MCVQPGFGANSPFAFDGNIAFVAVWFPRDYSMAFIQFPQLIAVRKRVQSPWTLSTIADSVSECFRQN